MMKLSFWGILFTSIIFLSPNSFSQSNCDDVTLSDARKRYEIGDFESVISMLDNCLKSGFNSKQSVQAYRLITMTYLAIDSLNDAQTYASRLIKLDPNFEPTLFDPPKFARLISEVKLSGLSKQVQSVSKKLENVTEAPATVIVISEDEIIRRGYNDLEALLSDLPGFDISRTFGPTYSNIYQRGYRSNNTDRTIFLIDGVEENDLWSNIIYLSRQYPLTNIKRVEVVYGPASTMYGANAFVGVINVVTKEPEEIYKENNMGVSAQTNVGNWNTRYNDVTVAGKIKDVAFSFSGRNFYSDEMDLSTFPDYDYSPNYYEQINYSSLLNVYDNAEDYVNNNNLIDSHPYYTINRDISGKPISVELTPAGIAAARNFDKTSIEESVGGSKIKYSNISNSFYLYGKLKIFDFTLGYQKWRNTSGGTNYFTDNNEAGARNGSIWVPEQSFFYIKYDKSITDELSFTNYMQYKVHSIHNDSKAVYLLNYSNGAFSLADLATDFKPFWVTEYYFQISKQLRNETKILYTPNQSFDLLVGLEIRNSQLQGNYNIAYKPFPSDSGYAGGSKTSQGNILGGNSYEIVDWGLYAQGSYRLIESLKLTFGGRIDYNKIREFGGYGTQFNPRIAVVYTPSIFIMKAIYSEAIKDASNWTKFTTNPARQLTNPNLEPEKVKNIEFSGGIKFSPDLYFETSVYSANYSGVVGTKIVEYNGGTTGQNQPIGSLQIMGVQSVLNYSINNYSIYSNYTFTEPKNTQAGSEARIGDIASHHFNAGINAKYFENLNINLRFNFIGERKTGQGTSVPANSEIFPAVILLNGSISYSNILNSGITLQLTCNNILNKLYFDPGIRSADGGFYASRTPQRERNFMLRALYDINFNY
ncbi:MAG: TonB-dependent receptor [Ignavibacteriaceae bacterium]|nr:TonB-dependent receptor [Ignavibacteriaceae bacterium]